LAGQSYLRWTAILGLSSIELAKLLFSISSDIVLIPAHIWTPWFSLFGSMSGFDSLEECFGEWSSKILQSKPAYHQIHK